MRIRMRIEKEVAILELAGKLLIGEGDVLLRRDVEGLLAEGRKKILINLKGVTMMDSSGLGELVQARERVGCSIKLLHVEDKVQKVLEMTRLIGVFETFSDEGEALASFAAG